MNLFSLFPVLSIGITRSAGFFGYLDRISPLEALILIAGVVLLIIELFIPGFGIAGATGIVLLAIGIALTASSPLEALILIMVLVVLVAIVLLLLLRSARKGRIAHNMILHLTSSRDQGYRASEDSAFLTGLTGTALSDLRPAGVAELAGKRFDVVTQGTFIPRGTTIIVIQAVGRRIVVETVRGAGAQASPASQTGQASRTGHDQDRAK